MTAIETRPTMPIVGEPGPEKITVHTFARVERLYPGETIVCLGGGSSLTVADVNFVRDRARVIAIKEAGHCSLPGHSAPAPWADVLYAADEKWWRFEKGAPHFKGLKFAIEPQTYRWPDVGVLRNAGVTGVSLDPSALCTGHNSGYQAINLAVLLGASRIVLLGYDMWRGPSGDQNWFGPHPTHAPSQFAIFLQQFATIAEPLKAAGVEVLNCSRQTVLTVFPRVKLEEVTW